MYLIMYNGIRPSLSYHAVEHINNFAPKNNILYLFTFSNTHEASYTT